MKKKKTLVEMERQSLDFFDVLPFLCIRLVIFADVRD